MNFIIFECKKCHHRAGVIPGIPVICKECNTFHHSSEIQHQKKLPSFFVRSKNYRRELRTWLLSGKPVRSDDEVSRIQSICRDCDKLLDGACILCGCPVLNPNILGNKILWATSSCPDNPPKWVSPIS